MTHQGGGKIDEKEDKPMRKVSVGERKVPKSEQPMPKPTQDLSALYVSDEIHEKTIKGIDFKAKELSGEQNMDILEKHRTDEEIDMKPYSRELITACIIEPENLDVKRLRSSVMTEIMNWINEINGLDEIVQKKLKERSEAE